MKTLSDIKELADGYEAELDAKKKEHREEEQAAMASLFAQYDQCTEITDVLRRLENCDGGEYTFDDYGDLNCIVEVPKGIRDLPFINDYYSQDFARIFPHAVNHEADLYIAQSCGQPIAINNHTTGREYYVYDREARKPIIAEPKEWMDSAYVGAVIANYQSKQGVFGDVVFIDYYGSFVSHFKFHAALEASEAESLDDVKAFQKLIDRYEAENTEE